MVLDIITKNKSQEKSLIERNGKTEDGKIILSHIKVLRSWHGEQNEITLVNWGKAT